MHLAILYRHAMPSFLNDHNAPIYTQNTGVLHLNDHNHYDGVDSIKVVNGHIPHMVPSHTSNDSFDGSSSRSSTHTSDTSDAAAHTNGNNTRTSTMSTTVLHNGVPDGDGEAHVNGIDRFDAAKKHQLLPNGGTPFTSSLPDRTVVSPRSPPMPNGTNERSSGSMSHAEPPSIRTSIASATSGSVQPSPIGMPMQQHANRGDPGLVGSPNTIAGFQPANQRSSLEPSAGPQRFSSPAQMSGNTGFSASTSNLHPGSAGLKHRHTLEVPRPGQPRGSRDGMDTALTSGRFSPTSTTPGGARRASLSLVRRNTRSMHSEFPRDEAFPDEDAMRWAEAYRQKRASKRKKKEEEDDDRVLVGTKVDEKHANWVTAYNMLTGIRVSVSRTNAKLDRPLTDADFEAKAKTTFDM